MKRMTDQQIMAPSPQQPLDGQGVRRIPGFGRINRIYGQLTSTRTSKRKHLKIATVNVATLTGKEEEVVEVMRERKIDILGLCETRFRGKTDKKIYNDYRLLCSGSDNGRHGVGFIVNPDIAKFIDTKEQIDERISISIKLKEGGLSLVQIYAPQQGRTAVEKEEFYRKLQQTVDRMKNGENLIINGDWNGHVGTERGGYQNIIGPQGIGNKNAEGDRIINFAVINRLSIMNTFYQHRDSHKWTWYRWNEDRQEYTEKSMIDLITTNKKQIICNVKAIPSVSFDADHRLVVAKVRLAAPSRKPYGRFNIEKLNTNTEVEALQRKVQERMGGRPEDEGVEQKWKSFSNNLKAAAEETIGMKKVYCGKKKTTVWWTKEVKDSVKMKRKAFRLWMKSRTPENRMNYTLQRNKTERIKRNEKAKAWSKVGRDLKEDHYGTKKLTFLVWQKAIGVKIKKSVMPSKIRK